MDEQLRQALQRSSETGVTKTIPLSLSEEVSGQRQPTAVEIQLKSPDNAELKPMPIKGMVAEAANPMLGAGDEKIQDLFAGLGAAVVLADKQQPGSRVEASVQQVQQSIPLALFSNINTGSGGSVLESGALAQATVDPYAVASNGSAVSATDRPPARPKKDRLLSGAAGEVRAASEVTPVRAETYKCDLCSAVFAQSFQLDTHLKAHKLLEQASGGASGSGLITTQTQHPGGGKEPKNKRKRTSGPRTVTYHLTDNELVPSMRTPAPGVIECRDCGVTFPNVSRLRAHQKSHTSEKPYKCLHCDAAFTWQTSQKLHMRIHTGEKPYPCQECDQRFASSSYLKAHVRRVHTKERPYACQFCDQKFSDWGNMRKHQRTHTQEAMHKCTLCGESFDWARHLRMHMSTIHPTHAAGNTPQQPPKQEQALSIPVVLENQDVKPMLPAQLTDDMDAADIIQRAMSDAAAAAAEAAAGANANAILTAAHTGARSTVIDHKLD